MNRLRGYYFIRKSANEMASSDWITFDEIERLLRKRKIDKNWLVRRGGDNEWTTIADLLEEPGPAEKTDLPSAAFGCVKCRVELRIPLRQDGTLYRCPQCGMNYKSVQTNSASPVILVIPAIGAGATADPGPLQRPGKPLPSEVKGALTVLNLDENANYEAIRQAHRDLVKSYHPDKVAHLGPDLQRLAEVKTKLINSSFRILEGFFNPQSGART